MEAKISVVIVTYNRLPEVKEAVSTLMNQSVKPFEIIVIDDASNPPLTMEVNFEKFALIRLDEEQGLSKARNIGINAARGDYIAFLDDDTVPSQNWIEAVRTGINSGAEVLGGPLEPLFLAKPPDWWSKKDFGFIAGVGNAYDRQIWGANMIFKRTVFSKIGLFNPQLGRRKGKLWSSEDDQIVRKAKVHCHSLFVPEAKVLHMVKSNKLSLNYMFEWSFYEGKSRKILDRRNILIVAYEILIALKNMLNPSVMFNKKSRVQKILNLFELVGELN